MAQAIAVAEFVTALSGNISPTDGAQRAVIATSDGNIHHLTFHSSQDLALSTAAHLDDGMIFSVASYVTADGAEHFIAAAGEGSIYYIAGQQQQKLAAFENTIIAAVAGYATADGVHHVFVATGDGTIYLHSFQPGQDNIAQQELANFGSGVMNIVGFVAAADGNEHVFVTSSDGYVHHFVRSAQEAFVQSKLAFFEESFISMTSYITPVDGLVHIIPSTRDGKLYHVIFDIQKGYQTYADIRDGIHFHDASLTPGLTVDILIRFYHLTESPMMFVAGYVTPDDGVQHTLVASGDGAVHHLSYQGRPLKAEEVAHEVIAQFNSMY